MTERLHEIMIVMQALERAPDTLRAECLDKWIGLFNERAQLRESLEDDTLAEP